jgi:hypothetical protein
MAFLLTPYDWLVFAGLAVNGLAFLLIFAHKPQRTLPEPPSEAVVALTDL